MQNCGFYVEIGKGRTIDPGKETFAWEAHVHWITFEPQPGSESFDGTPDIARKFFLVQRCSQSHPSVIFSSILIMLPIG